MKIEKDTNCCINCKHRKYAGKVSTKTNPYFNQNLHLCEKSNDTGFIIFGCHQFELKRKSKYNAEKTKVDSISFDSKFEAKRYAELQLLQKGREIKFFLRQPMFDLAQGTYRADFEVHHLDGTVHYEEVKGFLTPESRRKILEVQNKYGIVIILITRDGEKHL